MKKISLLLGCGLLSAAVSAGTVKFAPDASPAEKFAGNEFAVYYKKITGKSIYDRNNPLTVYIGKAAKDAKWFTSKKGKPEQWFIESKGNDLVITGDIRGTVWGIYEFLEKYMGCAFLAPDTEIIPSDPGWKLPEIKETFTPAIFRRALDMGSPRIYHSQIQLHLKSSIRTRFAEVRMHHGSPRGSHTAADYTKPWKDPDAPFARTARGTVWKSTYCLSSPEAVKRIAAQMCDYIEQDRKGLPPEQWRIIYDLSQNDGANAFCHCPKCKQGRGRDGSYTDLNNAFVNQVADIVGKKYPEVLIQTFAYNQTLPAPEKVKTRPNVIIRFCNSTQTDPLRPGTAAGKNLEKWHAMADKLAIWGYWEVYTGAIRKPYVIPRSSMQREMQFCRDQKVLFYYGEDGSPYHRSFYTFQYYLGHHLMVDPDADVGQLTDTFFNGYFGKAAPVMKQYLEYLEKQILGLGDFSKDSNFPDRYLSQEFLDRVNGWLDEAEKLTADDKRSNLHVRWERIPVDQTQLLNQDKFRVNNKQQVIERYRKTLTELYSTTADTMWRKKELKAYLTRLKDDCDMFARLPIAIPEQFKGKKNLTDLHWPDFHPWGGASRCRVKDPEAASGSAYEMRRDRKFQYKGDFNAVLTHSRTRADYPDVRFSLPKGKVPKDEKYHWYRLGSTTMTPDVWIHCGPGSFHGIDIYLAKAVSGIIRPVKEVWISLKLTGPAFVPGSAKRNGIFIDRVIVFEPDKPTK